MPDDLLIRLGGRIRRLRKQRGWTQAEMAERVGIDRSLVSSSSDAVRLAYVCLPLLEVLANGFGISVSERMRGI